MEDRAPVKAHIVIAGGGVLGLSVALHAARKFDSLTEPVLLLDKGGLGAGSSIRSGAVLSANSKAREYVGMARDSLRTYRDLGRMTGRTVGFRNTGVLSIFGPAQQKEIEELRRDMAMQRSIGVNIKEVGPAEIRLLAPGAVVADGTVGAYEPDAGIVDPRQTLEVFSTLARSAGATVRMGSEIQELIVEDGRVAGVRTSRGEIRTQCVVLTAGPWTASLLKRFDVETDLKTLRPSYLYLSMPGDPLKEGAEGDDLSSTDYRRKDELGLLGSANADRDLDEEIEHAQGSQPEFLPSHPVIYDYEHDFYAKPNPQHRRTRISRLDSSLHPAVTDPGNFDHDVSEEACADLRERLMRRLPEYGQQERMGTETNLVCAMPDGRGLIGPTEQLPGLFVITGFMGKDFNLAPSIGEGVAQMLSDEPVSAFTPAFFSPSRLSQPAGKR